MMLPTRPSFLRALFASAIGLAFVLLSIHSMYKGSFQMRGRANDVTTSEPVLFWGFLGFFLTMGLLGLYAGFRDVRYLRRRHQRKT